MSWGRSPSLTPVETRVSWRSFNLSTVYSAISFGFLPTLRLLPGLPLTHNDFDVASRYLTA
jgi:hypothetical protein